MARIAAVVSLALALAGLACGKKARSKAEHGGQGAALSSPTPDFTPIAVLRTPAGWLLVKTEPPAVTPTPAGPPASNPKS